MGIFHGDITIRHDTKQLAVSGNGKFHPPNSGNFKVKIWENHDEQLRFRGKRFSGKRWQKPSRMASRSSRINITGTVVRGWGLPENSARNLRPSPACPLIFVAIYMGLPSLLQQVPLLLLQVLFVFFGTPVHETWANSCNLPTEMGFSRDVQGIPTS